jgi:hypothetical protein
VDALVPPGPVVAVAVVELVTPVAVVLGPEVVLVPVVEVFAPPPEPDEEPWSSPQAAATTRSTASEQARRIIERQHRMRGMRTP